MFTGNPAGWFTVAVCILYLAVMFVFPHVLPDKMTWDSNRLLDMAETGFDGDDSYAMTARLFGLLPSPLLLPAIAALGCFVIAWMCGSAHSRKAQAVAVVLMVPLLTMGLLRPQKEVFVVLLSVASALAVLKVPRPWMAIAAMLGLYALYGGFVRGYFLLIGPLAVALMVAGRMPLPLFMMAFAFVLAAVLVLPADVYVVLQGTRDNVNMLRVMGTEGNNTFFSNPWMPDNGFAFIGNYLHAALRLNVPVLFHLTPQAFFLLVTNALYAVLLWHAQKGGDWRAQALTGLFVAHMLVLWLFEPDLGSYLRHISSVLVYLWPGLVLWQRAQGVEGKPMLPLLPGRVARG